jgi:protein gp37
MMDNNERAIVPITEALPELRAEQYADVCHWDAARMALEGQYEAADGEYLIKIRDALKPRRGLWQAYLEARGIPYQTALNRIHKAENHIVTPRNNTSLVFLASPESPVPTEEAVIIPRGEMSRLENIQMWAQKAGYYGEDETYGAWDSEDEESNETEDDSSWPPPDRSEEEPPLMLLEPEPEDTPAVPSVVTFSVEAWEEMHPDLRLSVLEEGHEGKAGMNQQKSDSIEWALWSWNPVTGCLHNCPYCYARDIANRFYAQGFKPTFHPYRLGAPMHQKVPAQAETELGYRNIFTCSMADLFGKWVPAEWIQAVLDVVRDCPQWNFLFLTKFPNRLAEFSYPENAWLGTSVDCQARVKNAERSFAKVSGGVKWLSIEPMLEPIRFNSLDMFNWVVIGGASSSTETPAWIPPRRWVMDLERQATDAGCMIYEKTNLGFEHSPSRLREYPGWERPEQTLPPSLKYLPSIG